MSVSTETVFEIDVPTKMVARELAMNIAQDCDIMTIEIKKDCKNKLHLYLDGNHVFDEPQEG